MTVLHILSSRTFGIDSLGFSVLPWFSFFLTGSFFSFFFASSFSSDFLILECSGYQFLGPLFYLYSFFGDLIQFHSFDTTSVPNSHLQLGPLPQWALCPAAAWTSPAVGSISNSLLDIFTNGHLELDASKYELLNLSFVCSDIQSPMFPISVNLTVFFIVFF